MGLSKSLRASAFVAALLGVSVGRAEVPGSVHDESCTADGHCGHPVDEDSQSLLQAFHHSHRAKSSEVQPDVDALDGGNYEQPPCTLKPGTIVTLTGGRSGKFCSDSGTQVVCDKGSAGSTEKFEVVDAGDGLIGLRGGKLRQMCADTGSAWECNRPWIKKWEWYTTKTYPGNRVSFQGARDNSFCSDKPGGVRCNANSVGSEEKFGFACVGNVPPQTFAVLYALKSRDAIVIDTKATEDTTDFTIQFCTDEDCREIPLVFVMRYTSVSASCNSRLRGAEGQEVTTGVEQARTKAGEATSVRFEWTAERWEISINGVLIPGLTFKHRTNTQVSFIQVTTSGSCQSSFKIHRCPSSTPQPPATTTRQAPATTPGPIVGGCTGTQFGCCADGSVAKSLNDPCKVGPVRCVPGATFLAADKCNRCTCPTSGLVAEAACTKMFCPAPATTTGPFVGGCAGTQFGCCADGSVAKSLNDPCKAPATTPGPIVGGCAGTQFGCCADGSVAKSLNDPCKVGPVRCVTGATFLAADGCNRCICPTSGLVAEAACTKMFCPAPSTTPGPIVGGCAGTQFGCCADGSVAKSLNDPCKVPATTRPWVGGCASTQFGCCRDGSYAQSLNDPCKAPATTPGPIVGGCAGTQFGCCADGSVAKSLNDPCKVGPVRCVTGATFLAADKCNQCICPASGLVAEAACTKMFCPATTSARPTTTVTATTTAACRVITCWVAWDGVLRTIAYNNVDITSTVTAVAGSSRLHIKSLQFEYVEGAYLALSGNSAQAKGCLGPNPGAIKLRCQGLQTAGRLEVVNSAAVFKHGMGELLGQGSGWAPAVPVQNSPATWTPGMQVQPYWSSQCLQFATFRVQTVTSALVPVTVDPTFGPKASICTWQGDPHLQTFDRTKLDELRAGKFWMVRHPYLKVQAMFCNPYNKKTGECLGRGPSVAYGFVIGGAVLGGHIITIEGGDGHVLWDQTPVEPPTGADFTWTAPGKVTVQITQKKGQLTIELPQGIRFQAQRSWTAANGARPVPSGTITMRALPGQDGLCGNFNGIPADDVFIGRDYRVLPCSDLWRQASSANWKPISQDETEYDINKPPCSPADLVKAKAVCVAKMPKTTPQIVLDECAFDVCALNDDTIADGDAQAEHVQEEDGLAPPIKIGHCFGTEFGCCADGVTFAKALTDPCKTPSCSVTGPFAGKYLLGYAPAPFAFGTLEEAQRAMVNSPMAAGITQEPYNKNRFTLRKGNQLLASPTKEISWLRNGCTR